MFRQIAGATVVVACSLAVASPAFGDGPVEGLGAPGGGSAESAEHAAAREAANAAARKYFPLKPADFGPARRAASSWPRVRRDIPTPRPAWLPDEIDDSRTEQLSQILPMGFGLEGGRAATKNSLFFGAPAPLYLAYSLGQHNNFGQYESISCGFELWTDTPYASQGNFRPITFGSTIQCNSPNVTGWGHTNLGEYLHQAGSAPALKELVYTGPNYSVTGQGTFFDNPAQTYTRVTDSQLEQVYQFFSLTIADGGNGGDGWLATPARATDIQNGAARCQILARRMDCVIVSDPFPFAPDKVENCSGAEICQKANEVIQRARDLIAQLSTVPPGQFPDIDVACNVRASERPVLVPDYLGAADGIDPAPGTADSVDVPNPEAGAVGEAEADADDAGPTPAISVMPQVDDDVCKLWNGAQPNEATSIEVQLPKPAQAAQVTIDPACQGSVTKFPEVEYPDVPYRPYFGATVHYDPCVGTPMNLAQTKRTAEACIQVLEDAPRAPSWVTIRGSCRRKVTKTGFFGFDLEPRKPCAVNAQKRHLYRLRFTLLAKRGKVERRASGVLPLAGLPRYC